MANLFKKKPKPITLLYLAFILFSLLSLWSGVIYRLYRLNDLGIAISIFLAFLSFFVLLTILPKERGESKLEVKKETEPGRNNISVIAYILLFMASIIILLSARSSDPLVTPWQVVPWYFFLIYAMATLLLLTMILRKQNTPSPETRKLGNQETILITFHYLLTFIVVVIVYRIGYGFDPFIHQSTVLLIAQKGLVLPKTLYYLSQYGLEVIFYKILHLPLVWMDKLLVPALAAAVLPTVLWRALNKWFIEQKAILFSMLVLLAIPFSFLILTTPQNFSYLYLLLVILAGLSCENYFDLAAMFIFSSVAMLAQPIAGIPALVISLAVTIYHTGLAKKIKTLFYSILFFLAATVLPLAFYFFEKISSPTPGQNMALNFTAAKEVFSNLFPSPVIPGQEKLLLNLIYLVSFNYKYLILAVVLVGIIMSWRHREDCRVFFIYLWTSLSIFVAFLLSSTLPFNFLISYERDSYSERILLVSAFLLLPFMVTVLYSIGKKLREQPLMVKWPLAIFFAGLITTSFYLSYPRLDNYFNSHEYAVSQNDIDAVRWIESDAGSQDYIVLANQQVSVAALRELGFKKYYRNNIFYYPIPTSSPLYQYYLDMVYKKPSLESMAAAMDLAGVNKGYFVLNDYWWASSKIIDEAKLAADSYKEFKNGAVTVFVYKK